MGNVILTHLEVFQYHFQSLNLSPSEEARSARTLLSFSLKPKHLPLFPSPTRHKLPVLFAAFVADLAKAYHCCHFTLMMAPLAQSNLSSLSLGGRNSRIPSTPIRDVVRASREQTHQNSLSTGTSIIRVTAVDADDPTVAGHATVMYQIVKGNEYFAIDNSGLYD